MAGVSHPVFARVYERLSVVMDRAGGAEHRRGLVARLSGRVVEIGAGNGRTFVHYPPEVTGAVAVEPEPRLRAMAARTPPAPVVVIDGVAEALPAGAGASRRGGGGVGAVHGAAPSDRVGRDPAGVAPGGQLRFFEHVAAEQPGGMRRMQQLADATLWPTLFGGCRTGRDTAAAGFDIQQMHRFRFPATGPRSPAAPHIRGRAVRPAETVVW